ncbi:MAG TPA: hypothetical protein VMZ11_05905, partial [Mycobacteriales bacterium]|nr:hypothetical protein [Mycobacteriales bacterium]
MTQTMFAPPPVAEALVEEPASSRRTVLVAGGLVAALALAAGGYFLLSGGSTDPVDSGLPLRSSGLGSTPVKPAVKAPVVKPAGQLPPTTSVPLGRDPFHALYILPPVAAPAAPAAGTGTNTGSAPAAPTTSGGTTSGGTTTTPVAPTSYKLVLTKVSGGTATFSVGGKMMLAKVGSVFGP